MCVGLVGTMGIVIYPNRIVTHKVFNGVIRKGRDADDLMEHSSRWRATPDVASVSKRFFSLTDSSGVDIVEGEDDITILATAVVIDLVSHNDDD